MMKTRESIPNPTIFGPMHMIILFMEVIPGTHERLAGGTECIGVGEGTVTILNLVAPEGQKELLSIPCHDFSARPTSSSPSPLSPTPPAPPPVVAVVLINSLATSNAGGHLLAPYEDLRRF